jgi:hypothetical protein
LSDLIEHDISHEDWREYEWTDPATGNTRVYRIDGPARLFIRPGGTTHRVVDGVGVAHCVPSLGQLGCALRWKNPEHAEPVNF